MRPEIFPQPGQPSLDQHSWRRWLSLWPLFLIILLLAPGWDGFPYPSTEAQFSDIPITHYPYTLYFRQALLEDHRIPLWYPTILSGAPFAANPLSGMWYPPGWLALFLPLPLGFNLLVTLHLLWGGVGMVVLLRREGLAHCPALLGALAFQWMPKLCAHFGAGHLTLLYAVPWTPWLLWAAGEPGSLRNSAGRWLPAVFLALIILADVRWAVYAGLVWGAYVLTSPLVQARPGVPWLVRARALFIQGLAAAGLSAPLLFPLAEFTRLSTRNHLGGSDRLAFSLPPERFFGLLFPDFGGFHEYMLYVGVGVCLLALLATIWGFNRKRNVFWAGVAGAALSLALGEHLPLVAWISALPGFDVLRAPSRSLFLFGIAMASLAAYGLQFLEDGLSVVEQRRGRLVLVGWCGLVLALAGAVWAVSGALAPNFAWGVVLSLVCAAWLAWYLNQRDPLKYWYVGLIAICLLDWAILDNSLLDYRSARSVLAEGRQAASFLAAQAGLGRVYSPSYSIPQQTAAALGLQLADGVDPLQLDSYAAFMQRAANTPYQGYSVTIPPFPSGEPRTDNQGYTPDAQELGWLNVGFVAAEFDLLAPGLELVERFGDTRIYSNRLSMPRAWVQPGLGLPPAASRPATALSWSPERIELSASGPGYLILSEVSYPGWRVWINGRTAPLMPVSDAPLRGVLLEEGEQRVEFVFQPASVGWGVAIGTGVLLALVVSWIFERRVKSSA